jgi:hypothetical protein
MTTAENTGATTGMSEKHCEEMLNAIGDSPRILSSSDTVQDLEDEEDDEDDTELDKMSDDDETGWVIGTVSKTVEHSRESFWQQQMRLDDSSQLGLGRCSELLAREIYEVWDCRIAGSGGCQSPNRHGSSHNIPNNIWRQYADS